LMAQALRALRAGGLYFDGVSSYVNLPPIPLTKFTVTLWMNSHPYDGIVTQRTAIARDYRDPNGYRVFWEIDCPSYGNRIRFLVSDTYTGSKFDFSYPVSLPNWYFVALAYGRNDAYAYVNGVLVQTGTADVRTELMDTIIKIGAPGAGYFKGIVDKVRIYNRTLTADEIRAIYERDALIRDGLVLLLDFSEYEGDIAYDKSGCGNHATIYGARWVVKKALYRM